MISVSNGHPRAILNGILDDSIPPAQSSEEQLPQNLPHLFIWGERGSLDPQIIDPTQLQSLYGSKALDRQSKYYTHQMEFARVFAAAGNTIMVQRLHPKDALKPSIFCLGIDIVADDVPVYERAPDGSLKKDEKGDPIPTGDTVKGYMAQFVVNRNIDREVGAGESQVGTLVATDGTQSTYYPLIDLEASGPGSYGNNVGLRIWAPTLYDNQNPVNTTVIQDQLAYLYRLQFVEREDTRFTPVIQKTVGNDAYIDFSLKQSCVNKAVDMPMYLSYRLARYVKKPTASDTTRKDAPLTNLHVYHNFLEPVLKDIYAAEKASENNFLLEGENDPYHQINIFGGVDAENRAYNTFRIKDAMDGGINMNSSTTYYATGGSDGDLSVENFDTLVKEQFDNYGELDYPFLDDARYPVSTYWDSGFTIDTKKSMISVLGRRKDLMVYLSTFIYGQPRLNGEEQRSLGTSLRTYMDLYPEAVLYGTSVCRGLIMMQSGKLISDTSGLYFPHLLDFAYAKAQYAGAGNGKLKSSKAYDADENNKVTLLEEMDLLWEPDSVRDIEWATGLNYAQTFNTREAYRHMTQSVYSVESSVLKDEINVAICTDLEKICKRAWRRMGSDARRTKEQYIKKSNELISAMAKDRYDTRAVIVPDTFYTEEDDASRVRYSCNVQVRLNKGKYIGSYTVVAQNQEDFA